MNLLCMHCYLDIIDLTLEQSSYTLWVVDNNYVKYRIIQILYLPLKCYDIHTNFSNTIAIRKRKKEEIWLGPMTKSPTPTKKSKKQLDNT